MLGMDIGMHQMQTEGYHVSDNGFDANNTVEADIIMDNEGEDEERPTAIDDDDEIELDLDDLDVVNYFD